MPITARLDEFGKPAWIALTVLGFMVWWPVGLATLAFSLGSGRMGCGHNGGVSRWEQKMQNKMERVRSKMGGGFWGGLSSGNSAFDDYRISTLKRLEEEQREFQEFLYRLRFAKDKSEIDQFMSERRNRPNPEPSQGSQPSQGQSGQGWQSQP